MGRDQEGYRLGHCLLFPALETTREGQLEADSGKGASWKGCSCPWRGRSGYCCLQFGSSYGLSPSHLRV